MTSPNQLSFLPDDYLVLKSQRRTNIICAGLFIIVMIAIVSAFMITERSMRNIQTKFAQVDADYTDAAKRIEQVQRMQEKQRTMAHQAELTASLLEKVPRSFLLADITNSMPAGVSLLDFTLETKVDVVPVKAAAPAANTISAPGTPPPPPAPTQRVTTVYLKMSGIAATDVQVAQFISKLNQSPLLKDVNLVISDEYTLDKEKLRKFQIEASIDPKAEIAPGTPGAASAGAAGGEQPTRAAGMQLEERP